MIRSSSITFVLLNIASVLLGRSESSCQSGCNLALGSYYVTPNDNLSYIANLFNAGVASNLLPYNPNITNVNIITTGTRVNVFFTCDCLNGDFLGHNFSYVVVGGDTYTSIAETVYKNLTTVDMLSTFNSYPATNVPVGATIGVVVNCSCGDSSVSKDYGLFLTYPLQPGENLSSVAASNGFATQEDLLQRYNPEANFSSGTGIVFIPARDSNGSYVPLSSRRKKLKKASLLPSPPEASMYKPGVVTSPADGSSPFAGVTVDKSVEFSYVELAGATDDFSLAYKIGGGGFGVVYYAELRGEKAAIKKMDMQATNEFLAELKVLTNVHHLNLVRLIGYCTEVSLFLVYEFIENGNLSEHLRGLGRDPLPWAMRVQIALDSARGLEYAQYGEISPKVDVYAFGVVLYELISAKDAIVKTGGSVTESKGLIALFEEAFSKPDPKEALKNLVDPRLGQDYPIDSVLAMAWLGKSCTQEIPQQRPTMRQIVVSLMTLSSATEDWDIGSFYDNQALASLMSGR
ncbi:STYKc [Musa troglodytarum]|uniref:STYKc n=1 Tax=Musa troglodytarum TaxID=320322 RepID=A0A9E7EQW5_9LILI|nr:STYKc [Musa troglodytarum]